MNRHATTSAGGWTGCSAQESPSGSAGGAAEAPSPTARHEKVTVRRQWPAPPEGEVASSLRQPSASLPSAAASAALVTRICLAPLA